MGLGLRLIHLASSHASCCAGLQHHAALRPAAGFGKRLQPGSSVNPLKGLTVEGAWCCAEALLHAGSRGCTRPAFHSLRGMLNVRSDHRWFLFVWRQYIRLYIQHIQAGFTRASHHGTQLHQATWNNKNQHFNAIWQRWYTNRQRHCILVFSGIPHCYLVVV